MPRDPDFVSICSAAKAEIKEVTLEQYLAQAESDPSVLLVDVREDSEWAKGHVPKAIHIGKGVIERDIAKHAASKDQSLVLYCGGGSRSALAAVNLKKMGYTEVASMIGGYRGYVSSEHAE